MDNARRGPKGWVWIAAIVAGVAVTATVFAVLARPEGEPSATASPSPSAGDACAGVDAQSINLDLQVVEPAPVTCFEIQDRTQVQVGAAALEPDQALELEITDVDGVVLASAASELDWDPEVTVTVDPGTYLIRVTGDGGDAPPFLIYTATFPPGEEVPTEELDLPTASECGASVPLLADDADVVIDGGEATVHHACLVVERAGFMKLGVETPDPSDLESPDLQLALYSVDGPPSLVRSADDTIGLDPEMSVDLEPGTYVLEVTAWFDGPTGPLRFYADDDADLFRRGEVTSLHTDATPDLCEDAPRLSPGDARTIEGETTYLCIDVPADERLTLEAATLTDQDLVLEVMGFGDDGEPYRLAWSDDNPYSDVLADFDPLLDQVIPEGTWLVAVTTYFTGTAADYDVRLTPSEPR